MTTFIGIDFSAAQDAAHHIWLTRAQGDHRRLRVISCQSLAELTHDWQQTPWQNLAAFLRTCEPGFIGSDVCHGLPRSCTQESWEEVVLQYPQHFPDADALRSTCGEQRRLTDHVMRSPQAPANLRIYRQTDAWLRFILSPLLREQAVAVAPFRPPLNDRPYLLEVCPSVTLRNLGLPHQGYKGNKAHHRTRRAEITRALAMLGVHIPQSIASRVIAQTGGDALDSLIAALTTWLVTQEKLLSPAVLPPEAYQEGWIYAPHAGESRLSWR